MELNFSSIHWLHGFLGNSEDWNPWASHPQFQKFQKYSYFHNFFGGDSVEKTRCFGLPQLGSEINQKALQVSDSPFSKRVLIGYSFGGRVALHSLTESPKNWSAAILISTHPGLVSSEERISRRDADKRWAERFLTEDWNSLIEDWNSQPVLKSSDRLGSRHFEKVSRSSLAESLMKGSLGWQEDFREKLKTLPTPTLWISGERDAKFTALMKEVVALNPLFEGVCVPSAGHRAPWDQPQVFLETVLRFLEKALK